jgi:hypothetical protein
VRRRGDAWSSRIEVADYSIAGRNPFLCVLRAGDQLGRAAWALVKVEATGLPALIETASPAEASPSIVTPFDSAGQPVVPVEIAGVYECQDIALRAAASLALEGGERRGSVRRRKNAREKAGANLR